MDLVEVGYRIKAEGLVKANKELDEILDKSKLIVGSSKKVAKAEETSANKIKASREKVNASLTKQSNILKQLEPLMNKGLTLTQAKTLAEAKYNKGNNILIVNLERQFLKMNQSAEATIRANKALTKQSVEVVKVANAYSKADAHVYAFKKSMDAATIAEQRHAKAIENEKNKMERLISTAYQMNSAFDKSAATKKAAFNTKTQNDIKKETYLLEYLREGYTRATAAKLASAKVSGVGAKELAMLAAARKATDDYTRAQARLRISSAGTTDVISNLMFSFKAAIFLQASLSIIKVADSMDLLNSRVALVTPKTESVVTAMGDLVDISASTRASLVDTITLYNRLTPAMARYGLGTNDVKKVVTAFSNSLLISGATARETSSAILQFSQSMAAGKLAGDEFRSVSEAAPEVLNAIARGSGFARDALKDMSRNGLLTTQFVSQALIKDFDTLAGKVKDVPINIQQSLTNLKTAFSYLIFVINDSEGATRGLADSIQSMSQGVLNFAKNLKDGKYDEQIKTIKIMTKAVLSLVTAYGAAKVALFAWNKGLGVYNLLTTKATTKTNLLSKSISLLGAAFVGWTIGKAAREKFLEVELAGIAMARGIHVAFTRLVSEAGILGKELAFGFTDPISMIRERFAQLFSVISFLPKKVAKGLGFENVAKTLEDLKDNISPDAAKQLQADVSRIRATTETEVENMKNSYDQLADDAIASFQKIKDKKIKMGKADPVLTETKSPFQLETERLQRYLDKLGEINNIEIAGFLTSKTNGTDILELAKERARVIEGIAATESFIKEMKDKQENPFKELEGFDFQSLFGSIGNPFSEAIEGATELVDKLNENSKVLAANKKGSKLYKEAEKQRFKLQLSGTADILGATKGFFKEKSKGYKVLEGVEKSFRAAELALALENFAVKTGLMESELLVQLATDGAKAASAGIAAAVSSMVGLPFPLNIAALGATVAAIGALGVSILGGSGGGGEAAVAIQQRTQGTGGTLGDVNAKSDSIAKSLEIMEDNTLDIIKINSGMLGELRSLNFNLNGLGNVLLRKTDIGGDLTGVQTGSSIGGLGSVVNSVTGSVLDVFTLGFADDLDKLVGGAFSSVGGAISSKKSRKTNEGIKLLGSSVADILESGMVDSLAYANIQTKKRKLGSGTKTTNSIETREFGSEIDKQFGSVIADVFSSIFKAVDILGLGNKSAAVFNGLEISTMGMSAEDSIIEIQAVLSNFADETATSVLPILSDLQQGGETAFGTLARVVTQFQTLISTMDILGGSLSSFGNESLLILSDDLANAAGGIEKFSNNMSNFLDIVLTDEDKFNLTTKAIKGLFSDLNISLPQSKKGLKDLVAGLDLATQSGQDAFTAITSSSSALGEFFDEMEDRIQDIKDVSKDIRDYLFDLKISDYASNPLQQVKDITDKFNEVAALAYGGDIEAAGKLTGIADQVLSLSQSAYASGSQFQDIYNQVVSTLTDIAGITDVTSIEELQYNVMQQQLDVLTSIALGVNSLGGGNVVAFAKGGAFTNSVTSGLNMAPMAMFGEAGPEAIMPLGRSSDGSLGVRLVDGGFNVTPIVSEIAMSNKTLIQLVRLQQTANKMIIERLDSLDERLETVESKTRLKDSA